MALDLYALRIDARQPERLAGFWAAMLGYQAVHDQYGGVLIGGDGGFRLRFQPEQGPKTTANLMHFDLTSTSIEDQEQTVAKALALGGRHLDIGQGDVDHVVLGDPEGNEFDVIEPGNNFLAGCGFIGALASDGSQAVGYFWAQALGWPLVWDENEETAVQSPAGGTKITWGGPPLDPRDGKPRWSYDISGFDEQETRRLIALGATHLEEGPGWVRLADPDGNDFRLLAVK
ncbi:VOC family protein [Actinoplanes sp. NPDC026670]|uniref:VOC family protein n=1 Tax=Actinoplanes sp. NPDC026670 TaxID=3154700 RepID=UPI0033F073BB